MRNPVRRLAYKVIDAIHPEPAPPRPPVPEAWPATPSSAGSAPANTNMTGSAGAGHRTPGQQWPHVQPCPPHQRQVIGDVK